MAHPKVVDACRRKRKLATEAEAEREAQWLRRRGGDLTKVFPYHCTACGSWHVGKSDQKRRELDERWAAARAKMARGKR